MQTSRHRFSHQPRQQKGVVLLVALITVVLLMVAGLATMRAADTATLLTGNLSFRESSLQASEYGLDNARTWLMTHRTELNTGSASSGYGYHLTLDSGFDPKTATWDTIGHHVSDTRIPDGYDVWYVVHRMCDTGGRCYSAQTSSQAGQSQKAAIGGGENFSSGTPYFQITTRTIGPRRTVSYVQVLVY